MPRNCGEYLHNSTQTGTQIPSIGFEVISPGHKIEEEKLPFYIRDEYYPMQIGDVVHDHYQVVAKLGYGTSSTVWLSRDLRDGKYWVLKVYINTLKHNQELRVYRHLANAPSNTSDALQACIGVEHHGNAKPLAYRAPEVMLGMPWGPAVDVWSAGLLAWDLLEKEDLFKSSYDNSSQEHNDACHLVAMTALLGAPPSKFLEKSSTTRKFWDQDGQWTGPVPLPSERTFESLATTLEGEDKEMFLNFVQCLMRWDPEERLQPLQAYMHPFLRGGELPDDFD